MRISFPPGARSNAFDRNATSKTNDYNAVAIAPHALTVRATYTIPAGKKFAVGTVCLSTSRAAAVTVAGAQSAKARLTPSGGAASFIFSNLMFGGAAGEKSPLMAGSSAILFAADLLELTTEDLNTAGSINYTLAVPGYEFDA
jgi:hypothetical protein